MLGLIGPWPGEKTEWGRTEQPSWGLVLGHNKAFHHDFKLNTYLPQTREKVCPLPKQ